MTDASVPPPADVSITDQEAVEMLAGARGRIFAEVGKVIVGQQDVVDQMSAKHAFVANVQVLKTADRMMGSLLDIKA